MRPNRAYIASLGTTGVLIASSLLLLVVVGTLVAFRGWPGGGLPKGLESLVVKEPSSVRLTPSGPAKTAGDAAPAAAAVAATASVAASAAGGGGATSTTTVVQGSPGTGRRGTVNELVGGERNREAVGPRPRPPASRLPQLPKLPEVVPSLTGALGNTTENATRSLGGTLGTVDPGLGQTVTDTGKAVSDLVRGLGVQLKLSSASR